MDAEHYANFLRQLGHSVREAGGLYWFNVAPRVYAPFPFEAMLRPAELELSRVLGEDGLVVRFGCDPADGVPSYRLTVSDANYDLPSLNSKSRNQTRRGLEQCDCGPVDLQTLCEHGVELNRATLQRQQRRVPSNLCTYWTRYFQAAADCPAARTWGAWHGGKPAAYLIAFQIGSVDNICIVRSDAGKLKHYPNNAMLFTYIRDSLRRPGVTEVSIGLQSLLSGMESLDHFKIGMGFEQRPFGQRIEFRRPWSRLLPRALASTASGVLRPWSSHEKIGRVSGLLSWYAQQPVIDFTETAH